ncbi:hypothetical protein [Agrobacterium rosae]
MKRAAAMRLFFCLNPAYISCLFDLLLPDGSFQFAMSKMKNTIAVLSSVVAASVIAIFVVNYAVAAPQVDMISVEQLPAETIELHCSREELQRKIEKEEARSSSSEYETMLSYALRRDGDGYSKIMANKSLYGQFEAGVESAVLISENHAHLALVKFERPANVNSFLKAVAMCGKETGGFCTPVLFYDGANTFCLLFTENEIAK